MMKRSLVAFAIAAMLHAASVLGATAIHLANNDTSITFEATPSAPRVSLMNHAGCSDLIGQSPETLIDHVEVREQIKPLHWKLIAAQTRIQHQSVHLVYESANPHLQLLWEWRIGSDHGPIEHTSRIQNLSSAEVWLPLQESLQFNWALSDHEQLSHFWVEKGAGGPSAEGVHRNNIVDGYKWIGESSTYAHPAEGEQREMIPYTLVERADESGCGWYIGIEFSGRTRISLTRIGHSLTGTAGLNPEPGPFRTRLKPGESFEAPTVFLGTFHGGADAAGNTLRRWVRQVLNHPATVASADYPLVVNNSWGSGMQIEENQARNMIRDSAELGFEMFHLDAGWFRGVGDWYPDPRKFPHGLASIADFAHQSGLKFGLWMDWAQASNDSQPGSLYINDPKTRNWLIADPPPGWKQGDEFKGITIDLGVLAAHDWAAATVNRVVKDYRLDMLEHDGYVVAQGCARNDHPHAASDSNHTRIYQDSGFLWADSSNNTDVSYHATRAYYDIHSQLRRQYPHLLLEICNDGGRMVDFGSAAHGDYFSISDAYDPLSNRRAFYDSSYVLPPAMLETYVEKWPTANLENFLYVLRSGMMGWFTLMLDTTAWSEAQHIAARDAIALYKAHLRPLIREADLYHVSDRPDGVHWDGIEYFDPKRRKGVLFAFHGSSTDEEIHIFKLKGLDSDRRYKLTFQDHSSSNQSATGTDLMNKGLQLSLPIPDSSDLVFLEEVQP